MTISERTAAARRERRVLARVSRAAWRLDQAGRERMWALVSARAEGISIRTLAAAIGLSPSRVHQLVAGAGLDAVIAAPGELRAAGWSAPEDPGSDEGTDLDGRDHLAGRLPDEADWLRRCAGWPRQLNGDGEMHGEPLEDLARDTKRTHIYPSEVRKHDVSPCRHHPRVCPRPGTSRGGVGRSRAGC